MATLATIFGGATLYSRGGKTQTAPPIQAKSSDEEKFIKYIPPKPTMPEKKRFSWRLNFERMVLICVLRTIGILSQRLKRKVRRRNTRYPEGKHDVSRSFKRIIDKKEHCYVLYRTSDVDFLLLGSGYVQTCILIVPFTFPSFTFTRGVRGQVRCSLQPTVLAPTTSDAAAYGTRTIQ